MRPSTRRSLATIAIAPLLALTVACGDNSDDIDDGSTGSNDSSSTVGQENGDVGGDGDETSTPDEDATEQGEEQGGSLPTGDDVEVDEFAEAVRAGRETVTTASVDVRVDADNEVGTGEGTLDLTGDRDALHLDLVTEGDEGGEDSGSFYAIDGVVLLKEDATSNDKFIQLEPELTDGVSFYSIFHPYQLTDLFLDHLQAVEHNGSDDVEGVPVEHYLLTVDPKAIGSVFGALASEEAPAPDSLQQHLWLDSDGRIVKSDLELAVDGDGIFIEVSLSDFGGPDAIEPPPASEIDDLSDLRNN